MPMGLSFLNWFNSSLVFQLLIVKFGCLLVNVFASVIDPGFPERAQHSCATCKESTGQKAMSSS